MPVIVRELSDDEAVIAMVDANLQRETILPSEKAFAYAVLAETKPNQQEQLKFKREELRKYFPSGYTEEQMRRDIIKGLELLKRQRERNRDAR